MQKHIFAIDTVNIYSN